MGQRNLQFDGTVGVATSQEKNRRLSPRTLALAALLSVVTAAAYLPSIHGGFLLDDDLLLTANPMIRAPDGIFRFWDTMEQFTYVPMASDTFWLEWRLWGLNPTGYHVTNVLLHIAAALLIWAILERLAIPGGYLAAFLFAVHPVNVESVAWIAQRRNVLEMLLWLLSILSYLKEEDRHPQETRWWPGGWYWLSLLLFVLALFSKGSVATMPVALLLIAWWRRRRVNGWDVARMIPFLAASAALTAVHMWFLEHGEDAALPASGFAQQIAGAGAVVWFYLGKAIAPIELIFFYPQWSVDAKNGLWWLPCLAAAAVTVVLFWRQWRGDERETKWNRALLMAWIFFVAALVPVMGFAAIGFMHVSLVADHYQHLAIIAVVALAGAGWSWWRQREAPGRNVAMVLAFIIIGVFTVLTCRQNEPYRDAMTLYRATLEQNPECWLAHNGLGIQFDAIGQTQEAMAHYRKTTALVPDYPQAHNNLGIDLAKVGRPQEAIEELQKAITISDDYAQAHNNLGRVLANVGRLQEAVEQYRKAIALKPYLAEAYNNLGTALEALGRVQEADGNFRKALEIAPDYAEAYVNLGGLLGSTGHMEQAITEFQRALQIKPNSSEAHNNLASAMASIGRPEVAIEQYGLAIKTNPGNWTAYFGLMKAYAQMHRSAEAIDTANRALALARSHGRADVAQQIEAWLKNYGNGAGN